MGMKSQVFGSLLIFLNNILGRCSITKKLDIYVCSDRFMYFLCYLCKTASDSPVGMHTNHNYYRTIKEKIKFHAKLFLFLLKY